MRSSQAFAELPHDAGRARRVERAEGHSCADRGLNRNKRPRAGCAEDGKNGVGGLAEFAPSLEDQTGQGAHMPIQFGKRETKIAIDHRCSLRCSERRRDQVRGNEAWLIQRHHH